MSRVYCVKEDKSFKTKVLPTFRPDKAINVDKIDFPEYISKLSEVAGIRIDSMDALEKALIKRMDFFYEVGCKVCDHALDDLLYIETTKQEANHTLLKALNKEELSVNEIAKYKSHLLVFLGREYHKRNWAQQYHINTIRNKIPNAIIRTTLIVGFPGETSKDFNELKEFVEEIKFDHLGVFTYSDEDDTVGFNMYPKVRQSTMDKRRDSIMLTQLNINTNRLENLIGETFEAIVDHYDEDINFYALRYYAQALDDVDGYIYVKAKYLELGKFYDVTITDFDEYDLIGEIKKED